MTFVKRKLIFIGAGLPSLLVAQNVIREARSRGESVSLTLFDADRSPGGLYRSHSYAGGLRFDHGMHIYYETGDHDLDSIWSSLLSESDWCVLDGNSKDIAGVFFNGRLQKHSPYPDLRNQGLLRRIRDMASICQAAVRYPNLTRELSHHDLTAEDYFIHRFGRGVYSKYFDMILRKLFGFDGKDLSSISTQLLALNRVVILPLWIMKLLVRVRFVSNRVAFPDQMNLPNVRRNHARGLYPKIMGIGAVTSRLSAQLEREGAEFHIGARVSGLSIDSGVVSKIHYLSREGIESSIDCRDSDVFWNAGSATLESVVRSSGMLAPQEDSKEHQGGIGRVSVVVDCLMRKPNLISPLYYFYCFDEPYRTFRVTNFAAYSPGASHDEWDQICVELWIPPSWDDRQIRNSAAEELHAMGVIRQLDDLRVLGTRVLSSGFPTLTLNLVQSLRTMSGVIQSYSLENFTAVGVARDPSIFFLKDVLLHLKSEVWTKLSWA